MGLAPQRAQLTGGGGGGGGGAGLGPDPAAEAEPEAWVWWALGTGIAQGQAQALGGCRAESVVGHLQTWRVLRGFFVCLFSKVSSGLA